MTWIIPNTISAAKSDTPQGRAGAGALVAAGADPLGRLHLDQGLRHELDALADHVDVTASADRVQQLTHVTLSQGHRGTAEARLARSNRRSPGGPTSPVDPAGFYTTRWDFNQAFPDVPKLDEQNPQGNLTDLALCTHLERVVAYLETAAKPA